MDLRHQALFDWLNDQTPFRCQQLTMISGDASFRRYFRFTEQNNSLIAVDAPPSTEKNREFSAINDAYTKVGIRVPNILAQCLDNGFFCLSDFGDTLFAQVLTQNTMLGWYEKAMAVLPAIQNCTQTTLGSLPAFDVALLESEYHLFSHWLCEVHLGIKLTEQEKDTLHQAFTRLTENFLSQPQVGVHRDYHSRNLMVLDDEQLGIIDYQDAVVGPLTYDLVSLLKDCYQQWPAAKVTQLLKSYHQSYASHYDWAQFKRWFDLTGMQRHIKASGIFARLCHRDGKQGYLKDIPNTLNYILEAGADYPEFNDFCAFVGNKVLPNLSSASHD